MAPETREPPWWSEDPADLVARLGSDPRAGLSSEEAARRLAASGPNEPPGEREGELGRIVSRQLKSPLLLLLVFAAATSLLSGEWADAAIVLIILAASVGIGVSREGAAHAELRALRSRMTARSTVVRDGAPRVVAANTIVPGDVVLLAAGSLVPADGAVLESTDCWVNESILTGESLPAAKVAGAVPAEAPLARRVGSVFMGTAVRSGAARVLIVETGASSRLGGVAKRLRREAPPGEFERGLHRFGTMLTIAMLVMVVVVFAINVLLRRPPLETLLFSIALAVGLSPELLPAILSINLARSAHAMAKKGVLVRRLDAIENLGSMDVLCTDKTGTLTEGVVRLTAALDPRGAPSDAVLRLALANARLQSGPVNPLDDAIGAAAPPQAPLPRKLAEIPYDFTRKRLSVLVDDAGPLLITKGAVESVLSACAVEPAEAARLRAIASDNASHGVRVLALATKRLPSPACTSGDEKGLEFAGFLTFLDAPKAGAAQALKDLAELGVELKLVTGDAMPVAMHVASLVGMPSGSALTGVDVDKMGAADLARAAERATVFAEVDPVQKERIIAALRRAGRVVGFMGDGANDAPAMHAADTSLSVDSAVDVARQAADFVLLERDLSVVRRGILEGRTTFANTLKYVLTTTSANLGNMASMALASVALPFLPLLAGQILLNNFLSDVPAVGLAGDAVDPELVAKPRRWDIRAIARFMVGFGLLGSLFDVATFVLLARIFSAGPELFRTSWFVESLLTELFIALVIRTRRPFLKSRPGRLLLWSTLIVAAIALVLPYAPFVGLIGFVPMPAPVLASVIGITIAYVLAAELFKRPFLRMLA